MIIFLEFGYKMSYSKNEFHDVLRKTLIALAYSISSPRTLYLKNTKNNLQLNYIRLLLGIFFNHNGF